MKSAGNLQPWKPLGSKLGLQVSRRVLQKNHRLCSRVKAGKDSWTGEQVPARQETMWTKAGREVTVCGT